MTAASVPSAPASQPLDLARARRTDFGRRLRAWYRRHARDLPWRRTRDAYHVLVSELMLQQTQVSRVVPRWEAFVREYPTLAHVARAGESRVCESWAGLGYYARARNLHRLAHELTDGGRATDAALPRDPASLRRLPGIGAYTAGAVASFAYERRAALVDTNVARVIGRAFAPGADHRTPRAHRIAWEIAHLLLPRDGRAAWTHNQAIMELGALVCTARVARCDVCPVRTACATYERDAGGATTLVAPPARRRGSRTQTSEAPR
jgi:A/G-specific adenine glycosylase